MSNGITKFAFCLIATITIQTVIVGWVWNNVVVPEFAMHHLSFGKVFMLIVAIRTILCEIIFGINRVHTVLALAEENNRFQFSSVVQLLTAAIRERVEKTETSDK